MSDGLVQQHDMRPETRVEVVALDDRAAKAHDLAEAKVRKVIAMTRDPVLHARVKLAVAADPAVVRPASAQATLDVNGQLVRAHVAAGTTGEAVDLLEQRLRDLLEHRAEHVRARRRLVAAPEPGQWRHGQSPTERPPWYDRPVDEREVVRRKTFSLGEVTLDEAVFDLEMLGHDFHLFRELDTGQDAVLRHRSAGGYSLQRIDASAQAPVTVLAEVTLEPRGAPTLNLDDARDALEVTGERFMFFRDPETGRGNILYQRYDGHYGLITPSP